MEQAAAYGYKEIAITDRNSFAGIVRAHVAAKKNGIRIIPGCRLDLLDGPSLLAYPTNVNAYSQLCNLLTTGNLRAEKGECHLYKADVYQYAKDVKFIVLPPATLNELFEFDPTFKNALKEYHEAFGNDLYIGSYRGVIMEMIVNIYTGLHNCQHNYKSLWLQPMMYIIMNRDGGNCRIS